MPKPSSKAGKQSKKDKAAAEKNEHRRSIIGKFRAEVNVRIKTVRRFITAQSSKVQQALSDDDQQLKRQQALLVAILREHKKVASELTSRIKKSTDKGKPHIKIGTAQELLSALNAAVVTLQRDQEQIEAQHAERNKQRRSDLQTVHNLQMATLSLEEAVLRQLETLAGNEVIQQAAQPWMANGFAGRFMKSQYRMPPTQQKRSFTKTTLEKDEEGNEVEAQDEDDEGLAELEVRERDNRVPPPTGFMTDPSSERCYVLLAQRNYLNSRQQTSDDLLPPMEDK
ncbi:MAG: hypothetical protein EHM73_15195 [Chroococcales cyanobacterium metabat2.561]|nr:MAG: hypothetical protein EHM73_15195 [Chroococcales cyanobacterium metabat2.561]